jgi:hypothetical protein
MIRSVLLQVVKYLDFLRYSVEGTAARGSTKHNPQAKPSSRKSLDYGIVITTFEERQQTCCLPLVESIRKAGVVAPITVVINGNLNRPIDDARRRVFVARLYDQRNINVVDFRTIQPLSRMWNLGIQLLDAEIAVVLNDDLGVRKEHLQQDIEALVGVASEAHLAVGGPGQGSFSHFAISKSCIRQIGWFDERFVGFGEEDGDYFWRFECAFGEMPPRVPLHALTNLSDPSTSGHRTVGGKYSLSTEVFKEMKYAPDDGGVLGPFQTPMIKTIEELDPYPLWLLHQQAAQLLISDDVTEIRNSLRRFT